MARKLGVRQEAFVEEIFSGKSPQTAAKNAGIKTRQQAAQVERSRAVREALKEGREQLEEISTIKRVDVLNGIMEAIDMARAVSEPATMISGWKEVAKIMGYYAPETRRIELTSDQAVMQKKLEQLSDQELLEMLDARTLLVDGEVLQ